MFIFNNLTFLVGRLDSPDFPLRYCFFINISGFPGAFANSEGENRPNLSSQLLLRRQDSLAGLPGPGLDPSACGQPGERSPPPWGTVPRTKLWRMGRNPGIAGTRFPTGLFPGK